MPIPRNVRLRLPLTAVSLVAPRVESVAYPATEPASGIAAQLQFFIDHHWLAVAVTAVTSKEQVLGLETVGYADIAARKPMALNTLFWTASITKPITATALMMLVGEGERSGGKISPGVWGVARGSDDELPEGGRDPW